MCHVPVFCVNQVTNNPQCGLGSLKGIEINCDARKVENSAEEGLTVVCVQVGYPGVLTIFPLQSTEGT
jgi:hypothetical protein